jgi:hypothetical protein
MTDSLPPPPTPEPVRNRDPWKVFGIAVIVVAALGLAVGAWFILGDDDGDDSAKPTMATAAPTTSTSATDATSQALLDIAAIVEASREIAADAAPTPQDIEDFNAAERQFSEAVDRDAGCAELETLVRQLSDAAVPNPGSAIEELNRHRDEIRDVMRDDLRNEVIRAAGTDAMREIDGLVRDLRLAYQDQLDRVFSAELEVDDRCNSG